MSYMMPTVAIALCKLKQLTCRRDRRAFSLLKQKWWKTVMAFYLYGTTPVVAWLPPVTDPTKLGQLDTVSVAESGFQAYCMCLLLMRYSGESIISLSPHTQSKATVKAYPLQQNAAVRTGVSGCHRPGETQCHWWLSGTKPEALLLP